MANAPRIRTDHGHFLSQLRADDGQQLAVGGATPTLAEVLAAGNDPGAEIMADGKQLQVGGIRPTAYNDYIAGSLIVTGPDDVSNSYGNVTLWAAPSGSFNPSLNLVSTRGTLASPTATLDGDILGTVNFYGAGSDTPPDAPIQGAEINATQDGASSPSIIPARLEFWTTNAAGGFAKHLVITGVGLLVLPTIPTSDPAVAGALYSDGAPSAGVPKALMVSGG